MCVLSGKWLPKWAFGLMHYGKDKSSAKTMPSVPLTRGKAPDKHMVYSILLSLGGPQQWAIQWGVPLRTGCLYLHFIIANRCSPLLFHCFMSAQFLYWCPFDKTRVGLCNFDFCLYLLPIFSWVESLCTNWWRCLCRLVKYSTLLRQHTIDVCLTYGNSKPWDQSFRMQSTSTTKSKRSFECRGQIHSFCQEHCKQ